MTDSDPEDYGIFSSEPGPGLGPDVADIRRLARDAENAPESTPESTPESAAKSLYEKLKGSKMPKLLADKTEKARPIASGQASDSSGDANPATLTEEIKKAFQVCLDDEANLEGLEDPDLVNHMECARSTYAESIISEKRVTPKLDALKAAHKQVLVEINSLLRALEDQRAERQRNTDEICVHGANAKRLSAGPVAGTPPPHGFPVLKAPVPPECLEAFKRLGAQITDDGDLSQKSVAFCEDALKRLTLLRRSIEGLLDSLWWLAENPKSPV